MKPQANNININIDEGLPSHPVQNSETKQTQKIRKQTQQVTNADYEESELAYLISNERSEFFDHHERTSRESDSDRHAEEPEEARKAAEAADQPRTSCPTWADLIDETERGAEAAIKHHQERFRKTNMEPKPIREKEGPMVTRIRKTRGPEPG